MQPLFIIYMIKVAIYLTAFYLVYLIVLSRDTLYSRNRAFILFSLTLSMIFPLFTFHTVKPMDIQFFGKLLSEVVINANSDATGTINTVSTVAGSLKIIYLLYIIGIVVLTFKLLTDLLNLLVQIVRKKSKGSRIIRFHGFNTAGFSAMGYIFINTRLNPKEAEHVIKHEQNHLRKYHFIDIIFIEILKAFQWFNPVIYLLNRSLRTIHEYQADHECLNSGIPVANYQSLLFSQVLKSRTLNLTNSFSNPSLIRRRMIMMTKKRTSALANVKLLIVIPVTGIVFLAISAYKEIPESTEKRILPTTVSEILPLQSSLKTPSSETKSEIRSEVIPPPPSPSPPPPPPPSQSSIPEKDSGAEAKTENEVAVEDEPFVVVEEMPRFPGGDVALLKFIIENTKYPPVAKEKNIQGKVIIKFCVTTIGSVSKVSVLRSVDPELDAAAMRVVESLPDFEPGKQGGKAVPVWYNVPINFTLK